MLARTGASAIASCSLSCRSIIYKGMMLAEQVAVFYPDLMDERFTRVGVCDLSPAVFHKHLPAVVARAAISACWPTTARSTRFRGNLNWMKSHEIQDGLSSAVRRHGRRYQADRPERVVSDSAALDALYSKCWCVPGVQCAHGQDHARPRKLVQTSRWTCPTPWRDMYSYCNSVMEPWDGPAAALAMTDGRWVCAGLDRNGLRPMRYVADRRRPADRRVRGRHGAG